MTTILYLLRWILLAAEWATELAIETIHWLALRVDRAIAQREQAPPPPPITPDV